MDIGEKSIFVTVAMFSCWPPPRSMRCASCGSTFKPDVVPEDVGGGVEREVGRWVGFTWSESSGSFSPDDFCWGCASLFMSGDYRGASRDFEVDLDEFAAAVRRVVRRARHDALNPQESDYPGSAVELIDYRLEKVRKLENAHVVSRATFDSECRVGWPYS